MRIGRGENLNAIGQSVRRRWFWASLINGNLWRVEESKGRMNMRILISFGLGILFAAGAMGGEKKVGDELFVGPVPELRVEIPQEGMKVLRAYRQVWRGERGERVDVRAKVIEEGQGGKVWTDVA